LVVLPFLNEFRVGLVADAAFVVLQRHVGEALTMQADEAGLEAMMAGWAEHLAAESANGYGREVALGFFHFKLLWPVVGIEGGTAEDVLECLVARKEKAAVCADEVKGLGAIFGTQKTDAEAFAAGENEAGDVE
jgi:hypothetical protein